MSLVTKHHFFPFAHLLSTSIHMTNENNSLKHLSLFNKNKGPQSNWGTYEKHKKQRSNPGDDKVNTETDTSLGWKQHAKLHTLLYYLSNVTTSLFATTQSATLHTFAGEGVGEIISGNIAHSVFIPVSDAGDAVYQ